jgi:hypothetical protein
MKSNKKLIGVVLLALGAFIIVWTMNHAPTAGIGEQLNRKIQGSYTMSEPAYYGSLVLGIVLGVLGLMRLRK